ncbi:hypothetical protein IFM61606_10701 [Aspergillus udagawae]|nr:hypothetical protein IFM61606_10701 [Aspergillus udagawae]
MLTTGHMFLTAFHIELIQAQPVMAEAHQRKVFLQIRDYPSQGNHPVVTRSTKPSFLYWEEYVTLLGYSLIYKHKYVEGLVKGLANAIATLKVVEIPQAGSRQYIGFLELPDKFSLDLQPGDAMKLNFNMKEPESHTDWHACVMDALLIAPPKAITILLTQPWDKDKQEWFNAAQQAAFVHLRTLPSGFGLIQGPPGIGKTYWAVRAFLLFLTYNNRYTGRRHQVMLLAPSNDVVNDLAVRIKEARLQFIPDHETIVVRCHALRTEEDLLLMPAKKQRPRPANARPPIIAEDDSTCDDGLLAQVALAQMLFKFQQAQTAQPLGVKDHWVKQVELSIAEFISFYEHYRLYRAGEEFNDEMWKDFRARSRELRDAVLACADAIIYTLHAAGEQAMHDNVQPQAILVDEAAHATEPKLWPALAFFNPNAFNPLADQLRMSLFSQLHWNGLHAIMLTEQHWMHESIAQMVNRFNRRMFRSPGQMLFLDVKDSFDHRDAQQCSHLNVAHRRVAAALVIRLLTDQVVDPAAITVLTPYRAQLREYQALFAMLHQQQPALQLYLMQVKTINSFQGRESSVVVLNLTVVSSLGFMREGNHLNIALSQAKHALYIIGNYRAMDRPSRKQKLSPFIRKLLRYILQYRYCVQVPDELMITLPDAANDEQNDEQMGGTWDENGMDLDGTAAQPSANDNHSATSGPPDATVEAQDDV